MKKDKLDREYMEMWWGAGNYYLRINDDPSIIEVMSQKQLVHTLAESLVFWPDQGGWDLRKGAGENDTHEEDVKDLVKIMDWLNNDHPGGQREPSPYFISDHNAHYNWIRRITHDD
jgi:hypothetical protein